MADKLFCSKGSSDSESKVYGSRTHVTDNIKITLPSRVSWWDGKKGVVEAKLAQKRSEAHVSGALFESFGLPIKSRGKEVYNRILYMFFTIF